jgi:hypothetical protein
MEGPPVLLGIEQLRVLRTTEMRSAKEALQIIQSVGAACGSFQEKGAGAAGENATRIRDVQLGNPSVY